ncbi:MAG: porin [Granulosicoccus sp.]
MNAKRLFTTAIFCSLLPGIAQSQEYSSELGASLRLGVGVNTEPETEVTLESYDSRVMWTGAATVNDKLNAVSYVEFEFDQEDGLTETRYAWFGLGGDFGVVTGGQQTNAFYDAVTSVVDIAYWGSCYFEVSCLRQSAVLKFSSPDDKDYQWMVSTILEANDFENDAVDGLDIGGWFTSGDMTFGAGISVLFGNDMTFTETFEDDFGEFEIETTVDFGTGVAFGISATSPLLGGDASLSLQQASDDYLGMSEDGIALTGTFDLGNRYAILGLADAVNKPVYLTLGYEKPIVKDRAFTYFEFTAVDLDEDDRDVDLRARLVFVFDFDILSAS